MLNTFFNKIFRSKSHSKNHISFTGHHGSNITINLTDNCKLIIPRDELVNLIRTANLQLPSLDLTEPLTAAEKLVALYMIDGMSYRIIAESLAINTRTVETHATNIMRKANCKTKSEFAAKANRSNLRDQLKGTRS